MSARKRTHLLAIAGRGSSDDEWSVAHPERRGRFLMVFQLRWSVLRSLGACALVGIAWQAAVSLT